MKQSLGKLWQILLPAERRKVLLMLLMVIFMAGAETLGVISITPFLSVLGRPEIAHENPLLSRAYSALAFESTRDFTIALGFASIVLVLASSALKTVTLHLVNRFVHLLRHSLSSRLLSRYLAQPYEFFLDRNPSILSKNVLSEVDQLLFDLVQPLSQLVAQGFVVVAMTLLVFLYDPLMAACIVGTLGLLYGLIYGLVRKRLGMIGQERREANGQRYKACNEVFGGIKDVKVTRSATAYQQAFDRASYLLSRHSATSETLNQSPLYIVESVGYSGLIVIALILLLRSNDIGQVLPALGLYGFAAYRMLPAAQIMYRGFAKLKFATAALDAIYDDFQLAGEYQVQSFDTLPFEREITLKDVSYAYPSAPDKQVLKKFNLTIPVQSSIGIVGKSGAGKSTLMDILLGLLEPVDGAVFIDGVAITRANRSAWQKNIGYVPQSIYLSDASVQENIAFGISRENVDIHAVERAARSAQIHDFIENELPQGYQTMVGNRGVLLSGGQCQRIGIARALYHDPGVLFFDEATSALDSETEKAINQAINELIGSKTVIVISHRAESLQNCEQLINISEMREGLFGAQTGN